MHRIVVTTPHDELISDVQVPREQLAQHIAGYANLPSTIIYVDGLRLTPQQRAHYASPPAQPTPPTSGEPAPAPATPAAATLSAAPDPTQLAGWLAVLQRGMETVCQGYEDIRRGKLQNLQDMQEYSQRFAELHMASQRELADEAVRQRRLTSQSLADIDVLDRAVKTTQLSASLAEVRQAFARPVAPSPQAGVSREGFALGDVVRGIMDFGSST